MENTLLADLKFTLEAFLHHVFNPETKFWYGYFSYNFIGEGKHQEHPGAFRPDPPLHQVKHGFGIQLTGGGAMAAFDIIGINFQERF
jgi:hypothetical protein